MAVVVERETGMKYTHTLWLTLEHSSSIMKRWAAMIIRSFFFRFEKIARSISCSIHGRKDGSFVWSCGGISSFLFIFCFFLRVCLNKASWCFGNVTTGEKTAMYFLTFPSPSSRSFHHADLTSYLRRLILSKVTIVASSKQNSFTPLPRTCLTTKLWKSYYPHFLFNFSQVGSLSLGLGAKQYFKPRPCGERWQIGSRQRCAIEAMMLGGWIDGWKNPKELIIHLSHEKNPGWLGFIGDYTIQLYGDYNKLL